MLLIAVNAEVLLGRQSPGRDVRGHIGIVREIESGVEQISGRGNVPAFQRRDAESNKVASGHCGQPPDGEIIVAQGGARNSWVMRHIFSRIQVVVRGEVEKQRSIEPRRRRRVFRNHALQSLRWPIRTP